MSTHSFKWWHSLWLWVTQTTPKYPYVYFFASSFISFQWLQLVFKFCTGWPYQEVATGWQTTPNGRSHSNVAHFQFLGPNLILKTGLHVFSMQILTVNTLYCSMLILEICSDDNSLLRINDKTWEWHRYWRSQPLLSSVWYIMHAQLWVHG